MDNTFTIFIPQKKRKLRYYTIIYILIAFCALVLFIEYYITPIDDSIMKFFKTFFAIMLTIYFLLIFMSYFIKRPLEGTLSGKLTFNPENVIINDEIIDISRIEDIGIIIGSYDNQKVEHSSRSIKPKILNGTDNVITFCFTDGARHSIHFQQKIFEHYLSIKPFIISLLKSNKISILKATTILNIHDYGDIQEFKNEINKKEPQI